MDRPLRLASSLCAALVGLAAHAGATVTVYREGGALAPGQTLLLAPGQEIRLRAVVTEVGDRQDCRWILLENGHETKEQPQEEHREFRIRAPQGDTPREFTLLVMSRANPGAQAEYQVRVAPAFAGDSKGAALDPGQGAGPGPGLAPQVTSGTPVKASSGTPEGNPFAGPDGLVRLMEAMLRGPAGLIHAYAGADELRQWPLGAGDRGRFLDQPADTAIEGVAALSVNGRPFRAGQPAVVGWDFPVPMDWDPLPGTALWLHLYRDGREVSRRDVTGLLQHAQAFREGPVLCQVKDPATQPDDHSLFPEATGAVGALVVRGAQPLAGNRMAQPGSVDGRGDAARFHEPAGLAWMGEPGQSDLLVADRKAHVLRRVGLDGTARTVLGRAGESGPGPGQLAEPTCLAVWPQGSADGADAYLLADTGNHRILRVDAKGAATVFAGAGGKGHEDGPLGSARFDRPTGLAVHGAGRAAVIYVADAGSFTLRRIRAEAVDTIAGLAYQEGSHDDTGDRARCRDLKSLALDPLGQHLFVVDGHAVRLLDLETGMLARFLGHVGTSGFLARLDAPSDGPAAVEFFCRDQILLNDPVAVAFCADRLLVANRGSRTVQEYRRDGTLSTLAGDGEAPAATCDGRFRDGAVSFPGAGYATFQRPGGMVCTDGPSGGSLVLADGCSLVRLEAWNTEPFQAWVPRPEGISLVHTAVLAGAEAEGPRSCTIGFSLPSLPRRRCDFAYEFTCLDRHGAELGRFEGLGQYRKEPLVWTITVPEPGPVTLRLKLTTPEGVTVVREEPWTVA